MLQPGELERLAEALELGEGDLAVIAAGKAATVAPALGALRLELARQYELDPRGPLRVPLGDGVPALRVGR